MRPVTDCRGLAIVEDKRWHRRSQCWVAPGELFDPVHYAVDVAREKVAKAYVVEHHYSGTYPAARLAVGLWRNAGRAPRLVGVAVFSVSMNQRTIPAYTGLVPSAGVELGRFVCSPEVAYNGESWFLRRAFALLRSEKPDVSCVLSFADPVARIQADGTIVKPEHWGTIYQASNALYVGRSAPQRILYAPDGSAISARALSKVRNEERGWRYCYEQLRAAGAPARAFGESLREWLDRVSSGPGFVRRFHHGNLAYVFGLDLHTKAYLAARHRGGLPYPKREVLAA